jgi:hypothetical protein
VSSRQIGRSTGGAVVRVEGLLGAFVPGEVQQASSALVHQVLQAGVAVQLGFEHVADVVPVGGVEKGCGIANHFRHRAGVAAHDRTVVGHGFQRRQAETLIDRGVDECLGLVVKNAECVVAAADLADLAFLETARVHRG